MAVYGISDEIAQLVRGNGVELNGVGPVHSPELGRPGVAGFGRARGEAPTVYLGPIYCQPLDDDLRVGSAGLSLLFDLLRDGNA
jgi:hypothetical protein